MKKRFHLSVLSSHLSPFHSPFSPSSFPFSPFTFPFSVLTFPFKKVEHIIDNKSKAFAVRIVKLTRFLQEKKNDFVLSKQILRSGTGIGANARERKNAQSKADFINKLAIALKEADETQYWLEILYESEIIEQNLFNSLNEELKEIIAIITSSIKTAKEKNEKEK